MGWVEGGGGGGVKGGKWTGILSTKKTPQWRHKAQQRIQKLLNYVAHSLGVLQVTPPQKLSTSSFQPNKNTHFEMVK